MVTAQCTWVMTSLKTSITWVIKKINAIWSYLICWSLSWPRLQGDITSEWVDECNISGMIACCYDTANWHRKYEGSSCSLSLIIANWFDRLQRRPCINIGRRQLGQTRSMPDRRVDRIGVKISSARLQHCAPHSIIVLAAACVQQSVIHDEFTASSTPWRPFPVPCHINC